MADRLRQDDGRKTAIAQGVRRQSGERSSSVQEGVRRLSRRRFYRRGARRMKKYRDWRLRVGDEVLGRRSVRSFFVGFVSE